MCCPTGSQCIGLAENTTKLCCRPDQNGCVDIAPVSCDIRNQNATQFPESVLTTSLLDAENLELPSCHLDKFGNPGCCPFGYLCDPDNKQRCRKQKDQLNWRSVEELELTPFMNLDIPRLGSQPTNSASSSATAAASDSGATASPNTDIPVLPETNTDDGSKVRLSIILGCLFGGLAIGSIIAVNLFCCIRNRRKKKEREQAGDIEVTKERISGPLPGQDFVGRVDLTSRYTHDETPHISKRERAKTMSRNFRQSVRVKSHAAARGLGISYGAESPPPMPSVSEKHYLGTPLQPAPLFQEQSWYQRTPQRDPPGTQDEDTAITEDAASDTKESIRSQQRGTYMSYYSDDEGDFKARTPQPEGNSMSIYSQDGGSLRPPTFKARSRPVTGSTIPPRRMTYQAFWNAQNALHDAEMPEEAEKLKGAMKEARPETQWGDLGQKRHDPDTRKLT